MSSLGKKNIRKYCIKTKINWNYSILWDLSPSGWENVHITNFIFTFYWTIHEVSDAYDTINEHSM